MRQSQIWSEDSLFYRVLSPLRARVDMHAAEETLSGKGKEKGRYYGFNSRRRWKYQQMLSIF